MFTIVGSVRLSVCLSDLSVCLSDAPLQCPSSRPLPALGIEMRDHHWGNVCLFVGLYVCMYVLCLSTILVFAVPSMSDAMSMYSHVPENSGPCRAPTSQSITASRRSVCHAWASKKARLAVGVYCGAYCCMRRSARAAYQSLHSSSVHQLPCSLPAFKTWWSARQKHLSVCSLPADLLHVLQQCAWMYPSNCGIAGKTREHARVVQRA
jgi:hypothetical protein